MTSQKISAREFRKALTRRSRREPNERAQSDKSTWKWAVEMVLIFCGGLVALGSLVVAVVALKVTIIQLDAVNDGLSSSAAAAVYQQQQDIDDIFVEYPEVDPYFSDKEPIPAELGDEQESKIKAVAFRILDHFEHIRYQLETGLFEVEEDAWLDYMETSFEESRVLCDTLLTYNSEYDGLEEDTLWAESAATGCAGLGIIPPPN